MSRIFHSFLMSDCLRCPGIRMFVSKSLTNLSNKTSIYTIPVSVGSKNQQFSLQIDTGSSDLVSSLSQPSFNLLFNPSCIKSGLHLPHVRRQAVVKPKVICTTPVVPI